MKKKYTDTTTFGYITATSAKDVVTQLRRGSIFFVDDTDAEYMKGYSHRASLLGRAIRYDNAENFVKDLLKANLLERGHIKAKKVSLSKKGRK
jgi:hypothetical protein